MNRNVIAREEEFYNQIYRRTVIDEDFVHNLLGDETPDHWLTRCLTRLRRDMLAALGDVAGQRVLVYGCGNDGAPLWFARRGACTVAIDIAAQAIANQRAIAALSGFEFQALAADAHHTGLDEGQFDIVYGNAILHHLDIAQAAKEVRRLLKPGGQAIFRDVLQGNFLMRIYRRLTPFWRTADEHPLGARDFKTLEEIFGGIQVSYYNFSVQPYILVHRLINNLILRPLGIRKRLPLGRAVRDFCDRIDVCLFAYLPFLKRQSWLCLIQARKS